MANQPNLIQAYTIAQPLTSLNPRPIIAKRAPTTSDTGYILGQLWIYAATNAAYILTSVTLGSANWQSTSGASGTFSSLTVNPGPVSLVTVGNGAVSIGNSTNTGAITVTVGTGNLSIVGAGHTISIGADTASNTVNVGSTTGSSTTTIKGGTGGISINAAAGDVFVNPVFATAASPTATVTINHRVGIAQFTGFTTASAASQAFTISNSLVTDISAINCTVNNLNASTNGALMTITGITVGTGSMVVTCTNNGGGALGAGDNVNITFWVMS